MSEDCNLKYLTYPIDETNITNKPDLGMEISKTAINTFKSAVSRSKSSAWK